MQVRLIKSSPFVTELSSQLLSPSQALGLGLKVAALQSQGCFLWQPAPILQASSPNFKKKILFNFDCAGSSLLHLGLFQLQQAEATLSLWGSSFSLRWLLLSRAQSFGPWTSVFVVHRLRLSCSTWVQLPHSMQTVSRSGIGPMTPALTGRFLTTGPQGKSFITSVASAEVWLKGASYK